MPDLAAILDEGEKLCREATPGPWKMDTRDAIHGSPGRYELKTDVLDFGWDGEEGIYLDNPSDAALVAFARDNLPLLLRLARAGDRLRKASEDTIHRCDEDGDCELCNAEAAFDAAALDAAQKEPR